MEILLNILVGGRGSNAGLSNRRFLDLNRIPSPLPEPESASKPDSSLKLQLERAASGVAGKALSITTVRTPLYAIFVQMSEYYSYGQTVAKGFVATVTTVAVRRSN